MASNAFGLWRKDRTPRLDAVEAHCVTVTAQAPPNPPFLDETLRGYVLHLSAHFQGFCRDLYTECSQIWIGAIPARFQTTAQAQFSTKLALENGNPNNENIKRDFNRFAIVLNLTTANVNGPQQLTDLGRLLDWRNKAAHQGIKPVASGGPFILRLADIQQWRSSCDGLTASLDTIMQAQLLRILGVTPW